MLAPLVSLLLHPTSAPRGDRALRAPVVRALCLGVNEYGSRFQSLRYAKADASGMARLIVDLGGVASDVSEDGTVSLSSYTAALSKAVKESLAGDTLVIFLAGHGAEKDNEPTFLMPGRSEDLPITGKSPSSLESLTANCAGDVVFIIDACRSTGSRGTDVPFPTGMTRGFADAVSALASQPPGGLGKRCVLYSCGKGEASYESSAMNGGAFTTAIFDGMKRNRLADQEGNVTVASVMSFAATHVFLSQDGRQNPWMMGTQTIRLGRAKSNPSVASSDRLATAVKDYRRGDFSKAAEAFADLYLEDSDPLHAVWAAKSLVTMGEFSKGFGILDKALAADPKSIPIRIAQCRETTNYYYHADTQAKIRTESMDAVRPRLEKMIGFANGVLGDDSANVDAKKYKALALFLTTKAGVFPQMISGFRQMPRPFLELREIILQNGGFDRVDVSESEKLLESARETSPEDSELWGIKALIDWCTKPGDAYKATIKKAVDLGFSLDRLSVSTSLREDEIREMVKGVRQ